MRKHEKLYQKQVSKVTLHFLGHLLRLFPCKTLEFIQIRIALSVYKIGGKSASLATLAKNSLCAA